MRAAEQRRVFERQLLDWTATGTVPSTVVIEALAYMRGMATRAVVSLSTGLNTKDSIDELDNFLEMLDHYPDVLPRSE